MFTNTQRRKGVHAPVTLPLKADSTREDTPAARRLQQEAVSCSLWPCCTVPRLSGVKCACDIAGREQRELNSGNYNQVRAQLVRGLWQHLSWMLMRHLALNLHALAQALRRASPPSPSFPPLPLSFHSSRPPTGHFHFPSPHLGLQSSLPPLSLWPSHCNTSALYRWCGVLHSITLHSFTLYNNRQLLRYCPSSTCSQQSFKHHVMHHSKFLINMGRVISLEGTIKKLQKSIDKSLLTILLHLNMQKEAPSCLPPSLLYIKRSSSSPITPLSLHGYSFAGG